MSELLDAILVSLPAIFLVVDPLATVPIFAAVTASATLTEKQAAARRAAIASGVVLAVFAVIGAPLLRALGITLSSLRAAGGVLLFLAALDMMRGGQTGAAFQAEADGSSASELAISPIAIPLLAGSGAIGTVVVLMAGRHDLVHAIPLLVSIALTSLATWLLLRGADWILDRLPRTFLRVLSRLTGLALAAIGIEFVMAGIRELR